jgi:hypothetical protein
LARKPLSIAFEEIAADKIVKVELPDYAEMEAEAEELFGGLETSDDASVEAVASDEVADEAVAE